MEVHDYGRAPRARPSQAQAKYIHRMYYSRQGVWMKIFFSKCLRRDHFLVVGIWLFGLRYEGCLASIEYVYVKKPSITDFHTYPYLLWRRDSESEPEAVGHLAVFLSSFSPFFFSEFEPSPRCSVPLAPFVSEENK
jgi:hypothetical protein